MQASYHLMLPEAALSQLMDLPQWCREAKIEIDFTPEGILSQLSEREQDLYLAYRGIRTQVRFYREEISDVTDINDELGLHLEAEHELSVNFHVSGQSQNLYLATLVLAIAVQHTGGLIYIEGDGSYIRPGDAQETAQFLLQELGEV